MAAVDGCPLPFTLRRSGTPFCYFVNWSPRVLKPESQAGVENHLDTKARGFTNNVLL